MREAVHNGRPLTMPMKPITHYEFLRRVRSGLYQDAISCRLDGMSADEWEERANQDPVGRMLGERAVTAISALVWGWDRC